jgi:small-conductance mechanosensitive channel
VLISGFALVIGLALALAILFTIAARGLTESLLNHPFIKASYFPGDRITCSACDGEVVKIDAAATHIRSESGLMIVPNRILAEQTVTVQRQAK